MLRSKAGTVGPRLLEPCRPNHGLQTAYEFGLDIGGMERSKYFGYPKVCERERVLHNLVENLCSCDQIAVGLHVLHQLYSATHQSLKYLRYLCT